MNKFISVNDCAKRLGISRATIYRWMKDGRFPQPKRMSPGTIRWSIADIEEWEKKLAH